MVQEVIWSPEAVDTYVAILEYLEKEWSEKEVKNFIARVNEKLDLLKQQPLLGRASGKKKGTYRTLINYRITLFYHYRINKKQLELVTFWNNLQNPKRQNF
jgi:plasmid stabilization system protein ParE